MMDIPPTTAISHPLVCYMVIHSQEFLLHFFLKFRVRSTIIIRNSNPFHQIKIGTHFYTELGQHILVPVRYNPFISFGSAHHINRYTRHLTVFISNLIEIIFLADSLHFFIREFTFCIIHVPETFLQQLHFFLLPVTDRSQLDIRLQKGVFVNNQPMIISSGIYKRHLQIGCLLTCIHFGSSNQMIDEKASF